MPKKNSTSAKQPNKDLLAKFDRELVSEWYARWRMNMPAQAQNELEDLLRVEHKS